MRLFAVILAAVALVAVPAESQARRRHRVPTAPAAVATAPPVHEFYPETVEGGSPGNLPFNNQIRKHTDPLNANGAGR